MSGHAASLFGSTRRAGPLGHRHEFSCGQTWHKHAELELDRQEFGTGGAVGQRRLRLRPAHREADLRAHDKLTSLFWNFFGLGNGRTRSNYEEVILTQALTVDSRHDPLLLAHGRTGERACVRTLGMPNRFDKRGSRWRKPMIVHHRLFSCFCATRWFTLPESLV